jgi:putative ABC transport system permease protein
MDKLAMDIRYAVRTLLKSPAYTLVAILTLALGIGANAAIFGVINAALLHPVAAIPQPDRLVMIGSTAPTGPYASSREFDNLSYPNYLDVKQQATELEGVAGHTSTVTSVRAADSAEMLVAETVTGNYFDVLGLVPARGRLLQERDDDPKSPLVAVIGYGFWRRLGGKEDVVGSTITVAGRPVNVVGVAPRSFSGLDPTDVAELWLPLPMESALMMGNFNYLEHPEMRGLKWMQAFGRMKPGVKFETAKTQLETIGARLAGAYPKENKDTGMTAVAGMGLDPGEREQLSRFGLILLGAVGLVLMLACTNIANLTLARAASRRRDVAIRVALGASRSRLVRQFLTESTLLALVAGSFGLLLSVWINAGLQRLTPQGVAMPANVAIDLRVVGFTFAISVLTGLLFGLAPALQSFLRDMVPMLKESSGQVSGTRSRVRSVLIVAEVSVSLVLLVSAGLLMRTLVQFQKIDPGFRARNVVMVSMFPGLDGYDEARSRQFYQELQAQLESMPGIQAMTASRVKPITAGGWGSSYEVQELPAQHRSDQFNTVMPNYFDVMGIDMAEGRKFSANDSEAAPPVAILSQTMARKLWPKESAVGKHIKVGNDKQWREIVGVARDVKTRSLTEDAHPYLWLPMSQPMPFWKTSVTLEIKTNLAAPVAMAITKNVVRKIDARLPLYGMQTLEQQFGYSYWRQRMAAWLIGSFAALALLLAAIGVYGVISYQVAARTRELGIRMALGARRGDVLVMVLRNGIALAGAGVAVGTVGGLAATRALNSLLLGVGASDPATFALSALFLACVALVASFVPAHRASRVDPMVALRYE